jgi:O-antigen polymerase
MKNKLLTAFFMLAFAVAAIMKSRAFFLGYCVSLPFVFFVLKQGKLKRNTKIFAGCFLLLMPGILAFLFKPDSSLGRLFIYKICLNILSDHFWSGIGINKFANVYRDYQAAYFKTGDYSTKELLLADNTQHAFNDYLQFIIETGALGMLILMASIYFIAALIKKAIEKKKPSTILLLACSEMIAISVAALFMHEYEKFVVQALFLVSLFIIASYAFEIRKRIAYISCFSILGLLCCFHYGPYFTKYDKYVQLQEANSLFQSGYINQALTAYEKLYPSFNTNSLFLADYGNMLSSADRNKDAIRVLKQAIAIDNNFLFYRKLAECYMNEKMFTQAEGALLYAINMVPNRFEPRFKLFNLYLSTGQKEKEFATGQGILDLPVKIHSDRVHSIQSEVRNSIKGIK